MSFINHFNDLQNKADNDIQTLSVRFTTSTINELDELSQTYDTSRSELINNIIIAGLTEMRNNQQTSIEEINLLESELEQDESNTRYFLLNTNYNNNKNDHYYMLEHGEASAFYGHWKENIKHIKKDDVVFLYQSGNGIVAYGKASDKMEKRDHEGDEGQWYARKLNQFTRVTKPISAKQCKEILKTNLNFRLVMSKLKQEQGEKLLNHLQEVL